MKSFNVDRKMKDKVLIRLAIEKVCKNKRKKNGKPTKKYRYARMVLANLDEYVEKVYAIICDTEKKNEAIRRGTYRPGEFPLAYTPTVSGSFPHVCDNGKLRIITTVPVFPDQIIHQLVVMAAEDVFLRGMYRHSYGSIPKRGVHKGKNYIQRYINQHKGSSAIKYVAKLDIKKCYPHIRHDVLKEMLRRKFRGHLFFDICSEIIDSFHEPDRPGVGIPIGFYTSQWFCNFLLTPVDYFIKQDLKIECNLRYVDDISFFGSNKKRLHRAVAAIGEKFESIGLHLKENWQIFRFDYLIPKTEEEIREDGEDKEKYKHRGRALDILGFRFFRNKVILRKRNALSIKRAARRLSKMKRITAQAARSFMSRIGALKHCNSRRFWEDNVKPYVNIKKLKEVIRNEDRKQCQAVGACY